MNTITVKRVTYLPQYLSFGVLYVSEKYAVAGHVCACGCGSKVITPLGPVEWTLNEINGHCSLWPSIRNPHLPCRSHYVITGGQIRWAGEWLDDQATAERRPADRLRQAYYAERERERLFWWGLRRFFRSFFKQGRKILRKGVIAK